MDVYIVRQGWFADGSDVTAVYDSLEKAQEHLFRLMDGWPEDRDRDDDTISPETETFWNGRHFVSFKRLAVQ